MHIVLYNDTTSRTSGVSSRTTKAVKQCQLLRFILLEDISEHSHFLLSDSAFLDAAEIADSVILPFHDK